MSSSSSESNADVSEHEEREQENDNKRNKSEESERGSKSGSEHEDNEEMETEATAQFRKNLELSDSDADANEIDANEQFQKNLELSDSDEDVPPEPEVIYDEIPSNRLQLGDLGPVFVRLPNFLSIEPKPFDERTYEAEIDDDEQVDMEGRSRMKLKIENTIRWRNVRNPETNEVKKQSNAKIVKWSDGTMSLHLGNEIFEIQNQKAMPNLHLFTRIGASLQAQSSFERKFTFRPHSTDTLTHRKMTMNMADKSNRIQKVKMVTDVGMNPEKARTESIKKEEEKLRALARKQAAQRKVRDRAREGGITSTFLEDNMESDEDENVGALKRAYGDSGRGAMPRHYGGFSDESEGEDERSQKHARNRIIDSSDEEADESQPSNAGPSEQRTKTRVIEDD